MKTLDELPIMIHDSTQILREGTMNMKEGRYLFVWFLFYHFSLRSVFFISPCNHNLVSVLGTFEFSVCSIKL